MMVINSSLVMTGTPAPIQLMMSGGMIPHPLINTFLRHPTQLAIYMVSIIVWLVGEGASLGMACPASRCRAFTKPSIGLHPVYRILARV